MRLLHVYIVITSDHDYVGVEKAPYFIVVLQDAIFHILYIVFLIKFGVVDNLELVETTVSP